MKILNSIVRISDREYFSLPAINASTLKMLVSRSPAEVRYLLDTPSDHRSAYDLGHAVHALALGAGAELVEVTATTWASAYARSAQSDAYARGAVPLLTSELGAAQAMAASVRAIAADHQLMIDGAPEVTLLWSENFADTKIDCKAKCDWLSDSIVDVKTTSSDLDDDSLSREIAKYKYQLQAAWYSRGYELIMGFKPEFRFIFVSKKPPYISRIVRLSEDDTYRGWQLAESGLDIWTRCQTTGQWPGYPGDDVIHLPRWAK